jgi:uncharacterized membrane protein YgcG
MARRTRLSRVAKTDIEKAHDLEHAALERMSGEVISEYMTPAEKKKYEKLLYGV